ncbi:hypothetical protein E2C01_037875 [Portunus trituberculatus]|uniref:Uncharacterized protein n=1 Tax=Portunus trituberculatus TaxID=210409 RepID=A0A5B7FG44_PORTR|nr:hypothetical protein [Portunus trituberculatus]
MSSQLPQPRQEHTYHSASAGEHRTGRQQTQGYFWRRFVVSKGSEARGLTRLRHSGRLTQRDRCGRRAAVVSGSAVNIDFAAASRGPLASARTTLLFVFDDLREYSGTHERRGSETQVSRGLDNGYPPHHQRMPQSFS